MKPGLRKVVALILASVTLFGSGASAVSAAYADDTTMVTVTGTRPEFTNSYIPPAPPAIVKTIRQLAKTGVSAPTVALAAFTLLGVGLMLFRRRGNQTETARHRK